MFYKINVEDISVFLKQNGYEWDGKIFRNAYLGTTEPAKICSFDKGDCRVCLDYPEKDVTYNYLVVGNHYFKVMEEDCGFGSIDKELILTENLSEKWINFLSKKYGNEYNAVAVDELNTVLIETANMRDARIKSLKDEIAKVYNYYNDVEASIEKLVGAIVVEDSSEQN